VIGRWREWVRSEEGHGGRWTGRGTHELVNVRLQGANVACVVAVVRDERDRSRKGVWRRHAQRVRQQTSDSKHVNKDTWDVTRIERIEQGDEKGYGWSSVRDKARRDRKVNDRKHPADPHTTST